MKRPGFVYLIASEVGLIKVGYSYAPDSRVREIQVASPAKVWLAHTWEFPNEDTAKTIERAMHDYLAWAHVRGEWHDVTLEAAKEVGDALLAQDAPRLREIRDRLQNERPYAKPREETFKFDAAAFNAQRRGGRTRERKAAKSLPAVRLSAPAKA